MGTIGTTGAGVGAAVRCPGRLGGLGESGHERGHRGVDRDPGGQRVRVGPVEVAQSDAVEGDAGVVLGGLEFACGLVERRAVLLGPLD